jgi:hypothetical protein
VTGERATGGCRRCAHNEAGQVVVLVALLLPVLLLIAVVVLDIGNMYVHKKHSQTLVDAGAFAGATRFVGCSVQFGDPVAANEAIAATALEYAGDTYRSAGTLNRQVQDPDDFRVVLNSDRFWADGDPRNGDGLDNTLDHDNNPMTAGDPCSSRTLDVKATDDDVPWLIGLLPLRVDPKSKARVEIQQVESQSGMLPWAVPDVEPAAVAAIFVDENTGNVTTPPQLLCNVAVCAGLPSPDDKLSYWGTTMGNDLVNLVGEDTGLVILVSKVNPTPSLSSGPGALTAMCTQAPGLVACYGGDGNQDGLSYIHGWSQLPGGTRQSPRIRDVWVTEGTCGDDLSAPYFLREGDCDVGVEAVIDFGMPGNPTPNPPTGARARVTLDAPGCTGQGCKMEYVGPAPSGIANESLWETTSMARLDANDGRQTFTIDWETEFPDQSTHSGSFGAVAHPYVADEASGAIDYLQLTTNEPGVLDANSRNSGPDRSVIVTVGFRKPLAIEDPLLPPRVLRVASPSGSQNQAFDCDRGLNFQTEIENGCATTYRLNYDDWTTPTPDGTDEWADIFCSQYGVGDLPPDTTTPAPPPMCVAVETGDKIGQFRHGLSSRFETPTCRPNNWPTNEDEVAEFFAPDGYDFANDPRYVTLIITDSTAFQGTGNDRVPIKYFAGFYVTGWDVVGHVPSCLANDPHPWYGEGYRKSLDNGDVWGHFVNLVIFSSNGQGSDELCDYDAVGNCIAVLVE